MSVCDDASESLYLTDLSLLNLGISFGAAVLTLISSYLVCFIVQKKLEKGAAAA